VFGVAAFAEAGRLPFDLAECEQELVGGYHTEYSGMKLMLFLVAEFLHMITAAFLLVILFLGGWHLWGLTGDPSGPITWGYAILRFLVLMAKVLCVVLFFMLARWTWLRFRFDQLMALAWKVMLPLGLVNFVAVAVLDQIRLAVDPDGGRVLWDWVLAAPAWIVCLAAWAAVSFWRPLVADNRARRGVQLGEIDGPI
jgi:NADH-quinone oxidoreductase subunit H